jgi:hypothetical protein
MTEQARLEIELLEEFGTSTFSEEDPLHKSLGWSGNPNDPRDYSAEDFLEAERTSGKQMWANPLQLNQGSEGACVGFGNCGVANAAPLVHEYGNDYGFRLYEMAKQRDARPGTNYAGTTLQAGAKAMVSEGHFKTYAFTRSVETLALFLLNKGPATIGVDWHLGMDRVDSKGFIHPTGSVRGGHCVVVDGVTWNVEGVEPNRLRIRNSWGSAWGFNGRARISGADLQALFNRGGQACVAVEVG